MPELDEFSDNDDVRVPGRTVLYNIEPLIMGSGLREGLISYLVRLSRAHCLRPRDLIRLVLAVGEADIARLCYNSFYAEYANTINGLGRYARLFSDRLNTLTGRQDLDELTMLPWAELIPEQSEGFIARHRRWCPHCMADQLVEHGEVFAPLAWSLEHYRNCAIHATPMQSQCPHCGQHQDIIPNAPTLSHCCKCGGSLALSPDAEKLEVIRETLIIELLSNPHKAKEGDLQSNFQVALRRLIDERYAGNRAAMCSELKWNSWGLKGWLDKGQRVSFPKLIQLMSTHRLQIPGLCCDTAATRGADISLGQLNNRSKRPMLSATTKARIQKVLHQELQVTEPQSITDVARAVDLTRSALRYWFSAECQEISKRRKRILERTSRKAKLARHATLLYAMTELRRLGQPITRRAVDRGIRGAGLALARPEIRQTFNELKIKL